MRKLYKLTQEEEVFISDTLIKELFFASHAAEDTILNKIVRNFVSHELDKLERQEIGSDDYAADIKVAESILEKLGSEETNLNSIRVGINLQGGIVQNVFANQPVEYTVIDHDVDGFDFQNEHYKLLSTGYPALVSTADAHVMPDEFDRLLSVAEDVEEDSQQ